MATRSDYKNTREYKWFEEGDEVYTDKKHLKAVTAGKIYTVIRCYKPSGFIPENPTILVEVKSDGGYKSSYASDRFFKTKSQMMDDKIKDLLSSV